MRIRGWRRWCVLLLPALALLASAPAPAVEAGPLLIGSEPMRPHVMALAASMEARSGSPLPTDIEDSARDAIERFCATRQAVALALHRRLNRLNRRCIGTEVEVEEIVLGVDATVVAVTRDWKGFDVTLGGLFRAIARDVPGEGGLHANAAERWSQIAPTWPDSPLQVLLPARTQIAGALLEERVLQAGCREIPDLQAIYSAAERTRRCAALRQDSRVREYADAAELAAALAEDRPTTLTLLPFASLRRHAGRLDALTVEGIAADDATIASGAYPLSQRLYLYLRRPVEGGRATAAEIYRLLRIADVATAEETVGPGGRLPTLGVTPLPMEERGRQRARVLARFAEARIR